MCQDLRSASCSLGKSVNRCRHAFQLSGETLTTPTSERALSRQLFDVLIRAGLIAALSVFCFRIFVPFLDLMVWALILAITLYPVQVRLRSRFPNRVCLIVEEEADGLALAYDAYRQSAPERLSQTAR